MSRLRGSGDDDATNQSRACRPPSPSWWVGVGVGAAVHQVSSVQSCIRLWDVTEGLRGQFPVPVRSSRGSLVGNPDFYVCFYPAIKFLGAANLPTMRACMSQNFPNMHGSVAFLFSFLIVNIM